MEQEPSIHRQLFVEGLKGIMVKHACDLEAARRMALEDAKKTNGDENIPLIEEAYEFLKPKIES